MRSSAERLARGEAAQGVITAIPKRRAARPAVHAFGRRQLARRTDGTPSWPSEYGHGRGTRGPLFPWGTGCWPPGGAPAQSWSEKPASLGTLSLLAAPPRRVPTRRGPRPPPPLRSGLLNPGPQGLVLPSGLQPQATLWKPWEGLGSFSRGGRGAPRRAEVDWAEGGFASVVFMRKPRPGGPCVCDGTWLGAGTCGLDLAAPRRHRAQACQGNLTLSDAADAADSAAPARRRASLDDCQPDAIPQATNQES